MGDWGLAPQNLLRRFRTDYQEDPHLSISFHSPLVKGGAIRINFPVILGCTYGSAEWVPTIVPQPPLGRKQEIHKAGRGTHCKSGPHQLHYISWRKRWGQEDLKRCLRDVWYSIHTLIVLTFISPDWTSPLNSRLIYPPDSSLLPPDFLLKTWIFYYYLFIYF